MSAIRAVYRDSSGSGGRSSAWMTSKGMRWFLGVVIGFLTFVGVGASVAELWIRATRRSVSGAGAEVKAA